MVIAPPTSDVEISSGESNLPGEDFLDDALKYVLFGNAPWSKMDFFFVDRDQSVNRDEQLHTLKNRFRLCDGWLSH